ncbi:MAG TPA: hypothetical protein VK622_04100 [Puia sp.]|nr:hypothetical protein [Puia sp.]
MHPLIRISFALLLLCFTVQTGFAGQGSVRPVMGSSFVLVSLGKLDSILNDRVSVVEIKKESELTADEANSSSGKICSCQVLNLASSNFDHRYVVLLAEKKNNGNGTAYTIAKNRIQKEKKHLKQMFYDKIKVVSEMQGTGSCKEMFYRLRTADVSLKLYEILNADIN